MKRVAFAVVAAALAAPAPATAGAGFEVVALGARGGIEDGNLTAFLISPAGDGRAITCDAGSLVNGLRVADEKGAFDHVEVPGHSPYTRVGYVLAEKVKGYLVSHAHLDHVAGLVIASPDDAAKPIYALPAINQSIVRNYFNWETWPNFGSVGRPPQLKKYEFRDLVPGRSEGLDGTAMSVTAFPLAHAGTTSTAFLIESGDDALLCFGDTGPDAVEESTAMRDVWKAVAGRLRDGRLRAIIIEVSYGNSQPDRLLFGHLTPAWLLKSLADLESMAGPGSLKDLPVLVGHIKYSLRKGIPPQQEILAELEAGNEAGVRFIIPEQGMSWRF